MELHIISIIFLILLWTRIFWLKFCCIKKDAVCLDYTTTNTACVIRPLFEYEMMENGKKVVYRSRGTALLGLRRGKRCKVLINKKDHNKVVGYNEYVVDIIWEIIIIFCIIVAFAL